jgi:hypothetical protein
MQVRHIVCGEILTVPEIDKISGLTEIVWQGRMATVFIEDLRSRAELVEIASIVNLTTQSDRGATTRQDLASRLTEIGSVMKQMETVCAPTA